MGIAIHVVPYFKTVNWIHAAGRVGERYIRKGNKNRNKNERWTWFIFTQYFGSSTRTRKEKEHKIQDEIRSIFVFFLYIFFVWLTLPSEGFSWLFLWFSIGDFNDPGQLEIRLISLVCCCGFAFITYQSIPAAPSTPGLLLSICLPCNSRGLGISKFCPPRGPGICQPRGNHDDNDDDDDGDDDYNGNNNASSVRACTSVCSSLGLIHDPMKQNITHEFSLQIPTRLFLYSMAHSSQSFKMERELHNYNILTL